MLARLVGFIFLTGLAWADGQTFAARYLGSDVVFDYGWTAPGGRLDNLHFALPIDAVQRGATEFAIFDQDAMDRARLDAMKAKAAEMGAKGMEITVERTRSGAIRSRIKWVAGAGVTSETIETVQEAVRSTGRQAGEAALTRAFYRRLADERIMPDHPRIVRRYAPALAPVTTAWREKLTGEGLLQDRRAGINQMMGWLQRIPYDRLMNRYVNGGGAGFQTPYGLFLNNRGDCDTKAVALLSILRGLYPDLPLAMIYAEDHAFVGIGLPQGPDDYALQLGDKVVVLADPTGPGMPLGAVDARSKAALERGDFFHLWI